MRGFLLGLSLFVGVGAANAAESRVVEGRVIGADGQAVSGVIVSHFWSANGVLIDKDDKPIDLTTAEAQQAYRRRFGQMAPFSQRRQAVSDAEGRFMASLPPGRYLLDAYVLASEDSRNLGELETEFVLTGETAEVDLGRLSLLPVKPNINERIKQSQASGALGDYTKHYGEKAPDWSIVDARGVSKNARLSDFKGKWVLLDFWALNCSSCLKHDLPELAAFYEEHKARRDQFEILAVCVDCHGELKSVAEVDRALAPITEHVWGGKQLPFPILLDPSMTTLERFGVPGYQSILIDPDGNFAEGDEKTLAKRLKAVSAD